MILHLKNHVEKVTESHAKKNYFWDGWWLWFFKSKLIDWLINALIPGREYGRSAHLFLRQEQRAKAQGPAEEPWRRGKKQQLTCCRGGCYRCSGRHHTECWWDSCCGIQWGKSNICAFCQIELKMEISTCNWGPGACRWDQSDRFQLHFTFSQREIFPGYEPRGGGTQLTPMLVIFHSRLVIQNLHERHCCCRFN